MVAMRKERNKMCILRPPVGMNSNITMAESESHPDPGMGFHRDADVIAVMLQNVNELTDVGDMLLPEVSHPKHIREQMLQQKKKGAAFWRSRRGGNERDGEGGNVDICGLLVWKKPVSHS